MPRRTAVPSRRASLRRSRLPGLVLGAVLAAAVTVAGPAAGTPGGPRHADPTDRPVPGLPVHLVLGDSWAAGQASVPPQVDYPTTAALWKADGYAAQLHEDLREQLDCLPAGSERAADGCRHLQRVDLSRTAVPASPGQPGRPGVTTQVLLDEQLPPALALLHQRNGDANPRNDVEVITLTVGGNDVFGAVEAACLPTPTPACAAVVQETLRGVALRYSSALAQLRAAAGQDATIVTTTYDNPIRTCYLGAVPGAVQLADLVLEGGVQPVGAVPFTLPGGLNDVIRTASAAVGAVVADTYGRLEPQDWVGGADCLHPDGSGHAAIADLAADAVLGAA